MDPKVKAEWIAALRSGKYKQGRTYLRKGDSYCCLGVLCEVMRVPSHVSFGYRMETEPVWVFAGISVSVPTSVATRVGLPPSVQMTLARMNDRTRCTFHEIADYISENL